MVSPWILKHKTFCVIYSNTMMLACILVGLAALSPLTRGQTTEVSNPKNFSCSELAPAWPDSKIADPVWTDLGSYVSVVLFTKAG